MKKLALMILSFAFGLLTVLSCCGQTAVITGPTEARIGTLIVLDSSESDHEGRVDWGIDDCLDGPTKHVSTFICGEKIVATASKPGLYTFELIVFKDGIDKTTHVVEFKTSEIVNPDPKPDPADPDPEPNEPPKGDVSSVTKAVSEVALKIGDAETANATADVYRQAIRESKNKEDLLDKAKRYRQAVMQKRPSKNADWSPFVRVINEQFAKQRPKTHEETKQFMEAVALGLKPKATQTFGNL